jgi:hypothetical protein
MMTELWLPYSNIKLATGDIFKTITENITSIVDEMFYHTSHQPIKTQVFKIIINSVEYYIDIIVIPSEQAAKIYTCVDDTQQIATISPNGYMALNRLMVNEKLLINTIQQALENAQQNFEATKFKG